MEETKVWYQSRGVWGGLLALVAAILAPVAGVTLDAAAQGEIVDIIIGASGLVGSAFAIYGRIKASSTIGTS